ncbi:MAG TPA: hypothetical protein VLR90_15210 [Blastocatellia bacterium]|nr:hypothetical protein [Blastocatellia bacterium]
MIGTTSPETLPLNFVQSIAFERIAEALFTSCLLELEPQWQAVLSDQQTEPVHRLLQLIRQAVAGLTPLSEFASALTEFSAMPTTGDAAHRNYESLGARFIARIEGSSHKPMADEIRERWQRVFCLLAELKGSGAGTDVRA